VTSDEQLMAEVGAGSRGAFEDLFERYRDPVWRFFARRLPNPGRAEELVQDVFLAILQNRVRYEPRAPFRAYLFGIAWNALLAEKRTSARAQENPIATDVADSRGGPDASLWVRRALASLPNEQRELVMLREYEGLTYEEIAALLRVPLNTVRSRLFRARMELREVLSREGPVEPKVSYESR
jgi:RNA polymerase sigma-70 factor (ECF subfamily)